MPKNKPKDTIKTPLNERIELELYEEDGQQWIWLGNETGSGAKYPVKTFQDIGQEVADYIRCYISPDQED